MVHRAVVAHAAPPFQRVLVEHERVAAVDVGEGERGIAIRPGDDPGVMMVDRVVVERSDLLLAEEGIPLGVIGVFVSDLVGLGVIGPAMMDDAVFLLNHLVIVIRVAKRFGDRVGGIVEHERRGRAEHGKGHDGQEDREDHADRLGLQRRGAHLHRPPHRKAGADELGVLGVVFLGFDFFGVLKDFRAVVFADVNGLFDERKIMFARGDDHLALLLL